MKRIILLNVLLFVFSVSLFSQIDTKKTNFYHNTLIAENEAIKLWAKNLVSKFNYAKFEFVIENNSDYFLLFNQGKCSFKFGNEEKHPKESFVPRMIKPGKKISPTLKVTGGNQFLADKFEFVPGGISKFSSKGKPIESPDFHLPANKNEFTFADFTVRMLKIKKETKQTAVQFRCTYIGDKIALISPANAVIKVKDGSEWANYKSNAKAKVLMKGDNVKITLIFRIPVSVVDMQFAAMDILWKNTFSEAEPVPVNFNSNFIEIDPVKTAKKNK